MTRLPRKRFRRGDLVTFSLLPGWLDDLREEDRQEIRARIGKPVTVQGYRRGDGYVELDWWEDQTRQREMKSHTIWLKPDRIKLLPEKSSKARAKKRT